MRARTILRDMEARPLDEPTQRPVLLGPWPDWQQMARDRNSRVAEYYRRAGRTPARLATTIHDPHHGGAA